MDTLVLYFDGSCNLGRSARYGWVIKTIEGKMISEGNGVVCYGKGATNNVAEYAALEEGLKYISSLNRKIKLICLGDSKLVVNQVNKKWKCKKLHLQAYRDRIWCLLGKMSSDVEIRWISRWDNVRADALSKRRCF